MQHRQDHQSGIPPFVVLEGLDGSGKSTCARHVAELLGGELLTTPSPAVRAFRDALIESLRPSQEACQLFYMSTLFEASARVSTLLGERRPVVLDRYFLSTQAYASFRGSTLQLNELSTALVPATLTVYLDAPLSVRLERLEHRGMSIADRETLSPDADARLRSNHMGLSHLDVVGSFVVLDSSQLGPGGLASSVAAALSKLAVG